MQIWRNEWLACARINQDFIAPTGFEHGSEVAKITPRALKVFSLRAIKLPIAKGPIFSQGPAARPATKHVDPEQGSFRSLAEMDASHEL